MTLSLSIAPVTRFHLSLNVADLDRAVDFYRILFGREPAKHHADYAKFEPDNPPLVFSLVPRRPGRGASLSHLGLRVADADIVTEMQQRLEAQGIATQTDRGRVCGGTCKDRCWVVDPDGNHWEIYAVAAQRDTGPDLQILPPPTIETHTIGPVVWEHFVTHGLPQRIDHNDASVDEVRLTGTWNASFSSEEIRRLLGEVARTLRPGGRVLVHGLMADRPFPRGMPSLPGLAAMASRVPVQTEPLEDLKRAGFVGMHYVKLGEAPWFSHDGVELREVKLSAIWPGKAAVADQAVVYRGPFREVRDESGTAFPRGQRVPVSAAMCERLRQSPAADQFVFMDVQAATGARQS